MRLSQMNARKARRRSAVTMSATATPAWTNQARPSPVSTRASQEWPPKPSSTLSVLPSLERDRGRTAARRRTAGSHEPLHLAGLAGVSDQKLEFIHRLNSERMCG